MAKKIVDIDKFEIFGYREIKLFVNNKEEKLENKYFVLRREEEPQCMSIYYKRVDLATENETSEFIGCVAISRECAADMLFEKLALFYKGVLAAHYDYDFKEDTNK